MNRMSEEQFLQAIREHLDRSIEPLPLETTARLDSARLSAVQARVASQPDAVANKLRDGLDELGELPTGINGRLDLARQQAMARYRPRNAFSLRLQRSVDALWSSLAGLNLQKTAGMVATACVVVTTASILLWNTPADTPLSLEDELALVASAEDFELYENLDFYLWLAENGMPN